MSQGDKGYNVDILHARATSIGGSGAPGPCTLLRLDNDPISYYALLLCLSDLFCSTNTQTTTRHDSNRSSEKGEFGEERTRLQNEPPIIFNARDLILCSQVQTFMSLP